MFGSMCVFMSFISPHVAVYVCVPAHPIEQGFCRRGGTPHRLTASATIVISQQVYTSLIERGRSPTTRIIPNPTPLPSRSPVVGRGGVVFPFGELNGPTMEDPGDAGSVLPTGTSLRPKRRYFPIVAKQSHNRIRYYNGFSVLRISRHYLTSTTSKIDAAK